MSLLCAVVIAAAAWAGPGDDALARTKSAAEAGDPAAQYQLGGMYADGKGAPRDAKLAASWYLKAAEQGIPGAQMDLGVLYFTGDGVPRDDQRGFQWVSSAAAQGYAAAQYNVGLAYYRGQGVAQDYGAAARWYRKSAERGNSDAQTQLGRLYASGDGVKRDDKEAVHWFREAAAQGEAEAEFMLAVAYSYGHGVPKDLKTSAEWTFKAAVGTNGLAQYSLGKAYAGGVGVPRDVQAAAHWFRRAAAQGDGSAAAALKALAPPPVDAVFMGDSITERWGDPAVGGFFTGKQYADEGVSGQTTSEILRRFPRDALGLKPRVVVILAGANDILQEVPPEETERNLWAMAELAHERGIAVVLASVLPMSRPDVAPERISALNAWIKDCAFRHGDAYLDFFSALADERGSLRRELSGDGVHLRPAGYAIMAPLAQKAVTQALAMRKPK